MNRPHHLQSRMRNIIIASRISGLIKLLRLSLDFQRLRFASYYQNAT